jgi:uncharacterized membrane protein
MKRNCLLTFFLIFPLIYLGSAQNSLSPEFGVKEVLKIDVQVNANGFVHVEKSLILDQTTARILIPKYSGELSLRDSQGNNLGYEVNQHPDGQVLNIYLKSPHEKSVTLSYNTPFLTRKSASGWTFKFSSLSTSRVTIIKINFPLEANITSLRSNETLYIYPPHFASPLFLYPQSDFTSLEIDYNLPPGRTSPDNFVFIIPFILVIFLLLLFLYSKKKKSKEGEEIKKEGGKINSSVMKMLDTAEKEVIKMLEASPEEEITQAYIYKTLEIPKSSLSDTIKRLEQRDLIEKKKEGRINWIKLKKWVFK